MHAAWHIPEIRNLILTHLQPGDFARLGRACKEISDCIIDCLWAELDTVDAFLSLLPAYPRDEPLKLEDLEQLDFYGQKVRQLYLTTEEGKRKIEVPQSMRVKGAKENGVKTKASVEPWIKLWEGIAQLRPQTAFLPNLQQIRIDNVAAELLLPLIGISGAYLEGVCIKAVHEPRDLVRKVLENFEETPKLEFLYIRNGLPYHVPETIIENSPLVTLRFDPTVIARNGREYWPLAPWVLTKSSVEKLTVGLTAHWHSPGFDALGTKFLPKLRELRLNLRGCAGGKCQQDCPGRALAWVESPGRVQPMSNRLIRGSAPECKLKPPSLFIRGLDHPHLELLNLKFDVGLTRAYLQDTMRAVVDTCHLDGLLHLVLSNGGHIPSCRCHPGRDGPPGFDRWDVWEMLKMLGPLPRLRLLRIPLAFNFLRDLDMREYKSIATIFPALQTLTIGHRSYAYFGQYGYHIHDQTTLRHVAAFCHLFPDLIDVQIGCVDATHREHEPNSDWACPNVRRLRVDAWATATGSLRDNLSPELDWCIQELQTYFPNADLTAKETSAQDKAIKSSLTNRS